MIGEKIGMKKERIRMKKWKYRLGAALMCGLLVVCCWGCGNKQQPEVATTGKPEDTVAVNAGECKVYLDEAKYYVYTAQATYEVYNITEGKEINWNGEMKKGVTWQQGVKSMVLDDLCRRECMYSLAEEYNVKLSDDEEKQIETEVENFFEDSAEKLVSKIGISENRLKFVFEKKKIADKVQNIMTTVDKKMSNETYEKWKKGNTVMTDEQWNNIKFEDAIFTLEDIK